MCASNTKIKEEYKIEDLPTFFKSRSKEISKKFSDKLIKISTIRFNDTNKKSSFEFYLQLEVGLTEQELHSKSYKTIQNLMNFFMLCLREEKIHLYQKSWLSTIDNIVKTRCSSANDISQGITIKLTVNVNDIDLDSLNQIRLFLGEELEQAEETQSQAKPTQQKIEQNKQVVPFQSQFKHNSTNSRKQVTRAPIVVAAMRSNFHWFISFLRLPNFLNTVQFFLRQPLELSMKKKPKAIQGPEEVKQDEVTVRKETTPIQQTINIPQNHIITDEIQPTLVQKTGKFLGIINDDDIKAQEIIKLAQNYAETEMVSNEIKANDKQKTLDEIFCETVITYYDPQFHNTEKRTLLANSVFQIIFLKNIPKPDKISEEEILNALKNFGLEFNKNYLIKKIKDKKFNLQYLNKHNIPHREKSVIQKLYGEIKDCFIIRKARAKAKKAIKNTNDKTRYEILIKLIEEYSNQNPWIFSDIIDGVFNDVFCGGKNLDEIKTINTFEEIFDILRTLEAQFNAEYLKCMILNKKQQLYTLAFSPKSQPPVEDKNTPHKSTNLPPSNIEKNQTPHPLPKKKAKTPLTNIRLRLSLENVLSSKETYFCLIVIGAFILTLCLWHLPLGKVPILQRLVPEKKRENIGLILNIGLPILVVLCVLHLAHFLYSEYNGFSVESVERINANKSLPGT